MPVYPLQGNHGHHQAPRGRHCRRLRFARTTGWDRDTRRDDPDTFRQSDLGACGHRTARVTEARSPAPRRAEEQRHLQGKRQTLRPAAHRVRASGATHRHHRRAAERGLDRQEAVKALNPLCTLRYSATHRNPYNLVYRLDPVRAFELKLVKQIVVSYDLC